MATLPIVSSSSPIPAIALTTGNTTHHRSLFHYSNQQSRTKNQKLVSFRIRAAKLPAGVELPKVEPKFTAPFLGFTKTAEIWNSRACMIGLIGTFIVELILNKGILQIIGVDVGKGLDLPL
ncbi:light-harvesting complex-like protein OHP1, chloroplastic [Macadamia integrifolia]|uniref:light-harvesting complex-like protein OHP1, chloroplastic n=1 Tax=Macadamia integrifolia TaxID=60698 RepID=UPI001C4EDD6B|nr:light-harvesting complex-like protein OHP1, chloroplastic [Macadamia integrifolia]